MNSRARRIELIMGILFIINGGLIYIIWRGGDLLLFHWFKALGLFPLITTIRVTISNSIESVPEWFCYSLPNAFWCFGGILIIGSIWGKLYKEKRIWIIFFSIIAVSEEIIQLFSWSSGTFDVRDLVFMLGFIILAVLADTIFNYKG